MNTNVSEPLQTGLRLPFDDPFGSHPSNHIKNSTTNGTHDWLLAWVVKAVSSAINCTFARRNNAWPCALFTNRTYFALCGGSTLELVKPKSYATNAGIDT